MIRKHSAKCIVATINGEEHHYVLVGGQWYYNGREHLPISMKFKDGFWNNMGIASIIKNCRIGTWEELKYFISFQKGTLGKPYIRHWETNNA